MKDKELIVNFSGGKDSTAMLHLLLEHGEKVDEVIYFDGGWEFPQMADHVALVEEKTGIKITRLYPPEGDFNHWATDHVFYNRQGLPRKGYGWAGSMSRWCTRLKIQTIAKHLRNRNVVQCIGYAVGEERRLCKNWGAIYNSEDYRFPLIEDYNYDEKECLFYCYKLGYDWGGLYEWIDRVSCFCCPLQSKNNALILKRHFPEMWERIGQMDIEFKKKCNLNRESFTSWRNENGFNATDKLIRGKEESWNVAEWIEKLNIKQKPIQIEPIDNSPTLFDDND